MAKTSVRAQPLIVVADDDEEIRRLVGFHLEQAGYGVLPAADGDEALALCRKHRPEGVVLDVMMPGRSGWEVCKTLRGDPESANIAVVILTGLGAAVNQMTSPLHEADEFIDKPFEAEILLGRLHVAIQRRSLMRSAVAASPAGGARRRAGAAKARARMKPKRLQKPVGRGRPKTKGRAAGTKTKRGRKAGTRPAAKKKTPRARRR